MARKTLRSTHAVLPYRWTPGIGPDVDVLARLSRDAPRPRAPMGEAWFMGDERRLFVELLEDEIAEVPVSLLSEAIDEMATGPCHFGPHAEWRAWYLHLLPRVIPLALSTDRCWIVDDLVTATISQYPDGLAAARELEARDVLDTLCRALMHPSRWRDGTFAACAKDAWAWRHAIGQLTSTTLLCVKLLHASLIDDWVGSVFAIADPRWRALVLAWLVEARPLLADDDVQPAEFEPLAPAIGWGSGACLKGNYSGSHGEPVERIAFLPLESKRAFRRAVAAQLASTTAQEWDLTTAAVDDFGVDLGDLVTLAARAYASGEAAPPD